MRKIYNKLSILLIIIIVSVSIYILLASLECRQLSCLSLKNLNLYRVKKTYEDNRYTYRALYGMDQVLLRVEIRNNYSVQESDQFIQSQIARTKGTFEAAAAPYPGELSDIISCSDEYKPVYSTKSKNGIQFTYFSGFINDRLVFGSCVSDQAKYKDTLVMFYCDSQEKFYQLEVITPNNGSAIKENLDQEILDSISCKN